MLLIEDLKVKVGGRTVLQHIDLDQFDTAAAPHPQLEAANLTALPADEQRQLVMSGLDLTQKTRAGTFFQKDTSVVHCAARQEGLEILPMRRALETAQWIRPQNVHNLVVVEEGAELHIITGCAVSPHLKTGLHVGVSEFFIKRNAKLTFTMIHNWTDRVHVRPRSAAHVEAGGLFISNYISVKPVGSLQMASTVYLAGDGAVARFYSIIAGSPGACIDIGGRVFLQKPRTRAEIIARTIRNGGRITARGHLIGEVPGIKAHLECRGLILNGGVIHAIPELEGRAENVEMSHEAAVGKIAQEEILYLMARGLSEEQAISTIVRGFLSVDIPELPTQLKQEIDRVIVTSEEEMM